ncbi:hypothetical protein AcW1_002161 [Taiwanofungus camphoratus]|nr:hypothetical protein AcW1_002161 [Antrodia cinnamomea]
MKQQHCVSSLIKPSEEKVRMRNPLSHAGRQLRDDLYAITKCPSREQQDALFAQISSLPGCEKYTRKNLSNFFSGRRRRENKVKKDAHLNAAKLTTLKKWIHECQNPTAVVMCNWAEKLHLDPLEIFRHVLEDGGCLALNHGVQQCENDHYAMLSHHAHEGSAISTPDINHIVSPAGPSLSMWVGDGNQLDDPAFTSEMQDQQYKGALHHPILSTGWEEFGSFGSF